MIISQLNGGLGNQMFQYSLGRVLSISNNTELLLDLTPFSDQSFTDTPRQFELNCFDIHPRIANKRVLSYFSQQNKITRFITTMIGSNLSQKYRVVKEKGHYFHPKILQQKDNTYLSGFWQSHKYFQAIEGVIKADFATRTTPPSLRNKTLTSQISSNPGSISLHIRRSDYVTNKLSNAYHGVLPLSYYQKAISYLVGIVSHPHFYIFSDDPVWVADNLKLSYPTTIISHNHGSYAHEDIRLMSHCHHHIIANSSFSWWGAWLGHNHKKIVIAPKKWTRDPKGNNPDLIPTTWKKL